MSEEFLPPPDVPDEIWEELRRHQAEAERMSGVSGAQEPPWNPDPKPGEQTEDGDVIWTTWGGKPLNEVPFIVVEEEIPLGRTPTSPAAYYPDGKPILDDELLPGFMKWALLFEQRSEERIVGQCKTLYGEKLSTVWLGLDHNWGGGGAPLIYETMLFAPDPDNVGRRTIRALAAARGEEERDQEAEAEYDRHRAYIEKHYPHDQLQLRYSTRQEAEDAHEKLKLQCLIPPRWRHFLLWTVGQDPAWRRWEEDGDDEA